LSNQNFIMKVFLSWSKPRSQRVAELLNNWIPCIIQSVQPWFSSQNIEDGELWFNAIQNQVSDIINGIVCLTEENKEQPWILFESGGLAKGLDKSRIYVLLIDLTPDDILLSPLSAFNQTKPTENGLRKLMHVINGRTNNPIQASILDQVYDKFWPDFKEKFDDIIRETQIPVTPLKKSAKEEINNDILKELFKSIRNLEYSVNSIRNNKPKDELRNGVILAPLVSSIKLRQYIIEFTQEFGFEKKDLIDNMSLIATYIKDKKVGAVSSQRLARVLSDYVNENIDFENDN